VNSKLATKLDEKYNNGKKNYGTKQQTDVARPQPVKMRKIRNGEN